MCSSSIDDSFFYLLILLILLRDGRVGLTTDLRGFLRIFLTSDFTDFTDVGYAFGVGWVRWAWCFRKLVYWFYYFYSHSEGIDDANSVWVTFASLRASRRICPE